MIVKRRAHDNRKTVEKIGYGKVDIELLDIKYEDLKQMVRVLERQLDCERVIPINQINLVEG